MHVLFVHKNFPAQFGHVAQWLVEKHRWKATYISELPNAQFGGLKRIHYKPLGGAREETHFCSRSFENYVAHSQGVHHALKRLPDIRPDLVVGHSGFGSTAFLPELYDCPIINYFEWFYHPRGTDMDFRPEFPPTDLAMLRARARNAMLLLDLNTCTAGYSPTEWQRSQFPQEYIPKIATAFDGIDTSVWVRQSQPKRSVAGKLIPDGARVVTYVSRGFEAMRGFDIFMRVAKKIAAERRDTVFIIVGQDRVCYGNDTVHTGGMTLKEQILAQGGFDSSRFIFPGLLPSAELINVLSLSPCPSSSVGRSSTRWPAAAPSSPATRRPSAKSSPTAKTASSLDSPMRPASSANPSKCSTRRKITAPSEKLAAPPSRNVTAMTCACHG